MSASPSRPDGSLELLEHIIEVTSADLDVHEVAQRVAALQPGVKILFLSGYTDDAVVRHGILEEQVAFLQKPYTPTALAWKVREVLDGAS